MKQQITFNLTGRIFPLVPIVKFYRDISGAGLRDSQNAIDAMHLAGKTTISIETALTHEQIMFQAQICGVDIAVGPAIVASGSIELLKTGQVRFRLYSGAEQLLQTVVPRKQAGRVLDTFLSTTDCQDIQNRKDRKNRKNRQDRKNRQGRGKIKRSKNKKVLE